MPFLVVHALARTKQQTVAHGHDAVGIGAFHQALYLVALHQIDAIVHGQPHVVVLLMNVVQGHVVTHLLGQVHSQLEPVACGAEMIDGATVVKGIDAATCLGGQVYHPATQMTIGGVLVQSVVPHLRAVVAPNIGHRRPPDGAVLCLTDREDALTAHALGPAYVGEGEVLHLQGHAFGCS